LANILKQKVIGQGHLSNYVCMLLPPPSVLLPHDTLTT